MTTGDLDFQVVDAPWDLPAVAGAYALVLELLRPLSVRLGRRAPGALDPGWYLYAGSARGPGGIRARVGRHLRADKSLRWHVDRLTNTAGVSAVVAVPGGGECAIVGAVRALAGTEIPVPGFGSSDCRSCPAHLLRLADAVDLDAALARLEPARPPGAILWRAPAVMCTWRPPA